MWLVDNGMPPPANFTATLIFLMDALWRKAQVACKVSDQSAVPGFVCLVRQSSSVRPLSRSY